MASVTDTRVRHVEWQIGVVSAFVPRRRRPRRTQPCNYWPMSMSLSSPFALLTAFELPTRNFRPMHATSWTFRFSFETRLYRLDLIVEADFLYVIWLRYNRYKWYISRNMIQHIIPKYSTNIQRVFYDRGLYTLMSRWLVKKASTY